MRLFEAKEIVEEFYSSKPKLPGIKTPQNVLKAESMLKSEDPEWLKSFRIRSKAVNHTPNVIPADVKVKVTTGPAREITPKANPIKLEITADVKIQVTEDYSIFRSMKGNRHVVPGKVKKLVKSIKEGLNLLKYCPILVNEQYEIIDGQHRFHACKELGHAVYFIKVPTFEISQIAEMNCNADKWQASDYIKCYKACGISDYAYLEEFVKKYPKIAVHLAVAILHTGNPHESGNINEVFKKGKFQAKYKEYADNLLKKVADFSSFESAYHRNFLSAIDTLLKSKSYDHQVMVTKYSKYSERLEKKANKKQYLVVLEEIYNIHNREIKRIY